MLTDGGIRRGGDILKALALGATAVLVGRPYVWGLAAFGHVGVTRVVELLRYELKVAMGLPACRTWPPSVARWCAFHGSSDDEPRLRHVDVKELPGWHCQVDVRRRVTVPGCLASVTSQQAHVTASHTRKERVLSKRW